MFLNLTGTYYIKYFKIHKFNGKIKILKDTKLYKIFLE